MFLFFCFFFFQAEDGIRDGHVTGVQTCALPISAHRVADRVTDSMRRAMDETDRRRNKQIAHNEARSEERRVGKECRNRSEREQRNKKKDKESSNGQGGVRRQLRVAQSRMSKSDK